jgi:hypothetical protein
LAGGRISMVLPQPLQVVVSSGATRSAMILDGHIHPYSCFKVILRNFSNWDIGSRSKQITTKPYQIPTVYGKKNFLKSVCIIIILQKCRLCSYWNFVIFRAYLMKYSLTFGITRWQASQRVMAAKFTRLIYKIAILLHLVAETVPFAVLAPGGQSGNFWIHPHIPFGADEAHCSTNLFC